MFGLSGIGIKIAIFLIVSSLATTGWFYVKNLQGELKLAAEKQARMDDVINAQKQAMDVVQKDLARMQTTQRELNTKIQEAEAANRELENKFNRTSSGRQRNFAELANKEPAKVEESINRGTKDALRCNELVTGSPLTNDEKAGKVRNTICPGLLPAYTGPATSPAPGASATAAPVAATANTESRSEGTGIPVPGSKNNVVIDPSKIKRSGK